MEKINIIKRYNAINKLEKATFSDSKKRIEIEADGNLLSVSLSKDGSAFIKKFSLGDFIDAIWKFRREED